MGTTIPALPSPSAAGGLYTPVVVHGGLAWVSGQLPRLEGVLRFHGKVGTDLDLDAACEAARLCGMQCVAALAHALGGTDRVLRALKLTGFVASATGFTQQPLVIDAASAVLVELLGPAGQHARSAIGVAELPHGAPVEVELVVALRP